MRCAYCDRDCNDRPVLHEAVCWRCWAEHTVEHEQRKSAVEANVWTTLVLASMIAGALVGFSWSLPDFVVDPASATFAALATLGIVATIRYRRAR